MTLLDDLRREVEAAGMEWREPTTTHASWMLNGRQVSVQWKTPTCFARDSNVPIRGKAFVDAFRLLYGEGEK